MKLTDRHHAILHKADEFGQFIAYSKAEIEASLELCGLRLLIERGDENSNYVFRMYRLTEQGERFVEALRSTPRTARVYVFATHSI